MLFVFITVPFCSLAHSPLGLHLQPCLVGGAEDLFLPVAERGRDAGHFQSKAALSSSKHLLSDRQRPRAPGDTKGTRWKNHGPLCLHGSGAARQPGALALHGSVSTSLRIVSSATSLPFLRTPPCCWQGQERQCPRILFLQSSGLELTRENQLQLGSWADTHLRRLPGRLLGTIHFIATDCGRWGAFLENPTY